MNKNNNDILQGNIPKTLVKLALPLMGMSALQMAYNLIDIYWISKLGSGPVAAVGTGGTIFWLCFGILSVVTVGSQVLVGQNIGAKNTKLAAQYAYTGIIYSIVLSIILTIIILFGLNQIISFFNLNEAQVIEDAKTYLFWAGIFVVFPLFSRLLITLITVSGNTKTPFIASSIGLIVNIVLDPLLIFGVAGFPQMGVAGAAIATVIAQVIVCVLLVFYVKRDKLLFNQINYKELPKLVLYKNITKIGFPVMLQNVTLPIIAMFISRLVATFGDAAVAVQRIGSQIESISWMTTDGFGIAVNAFVAQNFGAKNYMRAKQGFYNASYILSGIGIFATVLLIFGAEPLFSIFLDESSVLEMGKQYLIILGISQLFLCYEMLSSSAMNACGKTTFPSIVNMSLTFARIPASYILSATALGLNGIWWSITGSTILKGTILFVAIVVYFNKLTKNKISI